MKQGKVRFDERVYAQIWSAVNHTGDQDLLAVFKESLKKSNVPDHYEMTDWIMNGILEDLHNYGNDLYKSIALYCC